MNHHQSRAQKTFPG